MYALDLCTFTIADFAIHFLDNGTPTPFAGYVFCLGMTMDLEGTHIYVVNSILQRSHAHNYKNKGRL